VRLLLGYQVLASLLAEQFTLVILAALSCVGVLLKLPPGVNSTGADVVVPV